MRVLYFSRDYTSHDHRFLAALTGAGHQVHYLRLETGGAREDRPLPAGVQALAWRDAARPFRWWDWPGLLAGVRRLLQQVQPDLVHAGPIQSCAFPVAAAGFRPLIAMSWGSDLLVGARRGLGRWLARYALRRASLTFADCETVKQKGMELGVPQDRIVVFPWGVDLAHFAPGEAADLRERLGWERAFVVLSTRTMERLYGVDVLVEGFIRAARANPDLRLLLLGEGSLRRRLEAELETAGMKDRARFAGQVGFDSLPAYFRAANLYVSASHSDGSSISLLEAMACGLPALVSDIPANREWVQPGENGWLFADGDPAALAEGLLQAAEAGAALRAMGKRARAVAEARADWPRNAARMLQAYQQAVALEGGEAR